jgi:opacity protein-like surface antigen
MEKTKTMKRFLLTAALLAATATTALASSANETVTLRNAGYWTSWYSPANSAGKAMCGMASTINYASGAKAMFMVKYSGETVFVHVYKTSWTIPEGTKIPVWLQFDRAEPLTTTAAGSPGETVGGYVEFTIKPDFTKDFLELFANANAMSIGFQQGSEKPWAVNMSGSREVAESFGKCSNMLRQSSTQPYGNSPSPSQPYGNAPAKPSQPFKDRFPAPQDGGV